MAFSPQRYHDPTLPPPQSAQDENYINLQLAEQCGLTVPQVAYLRSEFKALGRNPFDSSLEIIALEQGLDEQKVKRCARTVLSQKRSEYAKEFLGQHHVIIQTQSFLASPQLFELHLSLLRRHDGFSARLDSS